VRRIGLSILALGLATQAQAQNLGISASDALASLRNSAGDKASALSCSGRFDQTCSLDLGKSFAVTTEATPSGELISLTMKYREVFGEPPENAADYVLFVLQAVGAGDNAEQFIALINKAIHSEGPVEDTFGNAHYRVDAGGETFLEIRPREP
jgi:hypothetical protein